MCDLGSCPDCVLKSYNQYSHKQFLGEEIDPMKQIITDTLKTSVEAFRSGYVSKATWQAKLDLAIFKINDYLKYLELWKNQKKTIFGSSHPINNVTWQFLPTRLQAIAMWGSVPGPQLIVPVLWGDETQYTTSPEAVQTPSSVQESQYNPAWTIVDPTMLFNGRIAMLRSTDPISAQWVGRLLTVNFSGTDVSPYIAFFQAVRAELADIYEKTNTLNRDVLEAGNNRNRLAVELNALKSSLNDSLKQASVYYPSLPTIEAMESLIAKGLPIVLFPEEKPVLADVLKSDVTVPVQAPKSKMPLIAGLAAAGLVAFNMMKGE